MKNPVYPVVIEHDVEGKEIVIVFPDFPEIVSRYPVGFLKTQADLISRAEDALIAALIGRIEADEEIPGPRRIPNKSFEVVLGPLVALKLTLYNELQTAGISRRELARRLNKNDAIVRRMLDLEHNSKVDQIEDALRVLGRMPVCSIRVISPEISIPTEAAQELELSS